MPITNLNLPESDSPKGLSLETLQSLAAARDETVETYINKAVAFLNGFLPKYDDIEDYSAGLREAGIQKEGPLRLKLTYLERLLLGRDDPC